MLKHFVIDFINIGAGLPGQGGAANPSTERIDNNFTGRVTQAGRGRSINDPSATLSCFVVSLPSDVKLTQMFSSGVLLNLHLIL